MAWVAKGILLRRLSSIEKPQNWGVLQDASTAQEILVALASRGGGSLAQCMVGRDKWYGRLPGGQDEGLKLVRESERQGNATAYLYLENLEQNGEL